MIRKIGLLGRGYRHIKRYREIITVLVKYGFGDLIEKSKLDRYIDFGKKLFPWKKNVEKVPLTRWERIRMTFEELGPTFIKLGQVMSNRPDLLPDELIEQLEKLQDAVPPFPVDESKKLIEEELGKPIKELFPGFVDIPVASASIAQVHKATLPDGDPVAVKVQRPGIDKTIEIDLEIMLHFAMLMERYIEGAETLNLVGIVEEFERVISRELNFYIEASHIERFSKNFQKDMTLYVPKVYRESSTRRILVMEYVEGERLANILADNNNNFDRALLAKMGANLIFKQVFEHGCFHADPHPGNIFIMEDNVICLLDFGMVGEISQKEKEHIISMIFGVIKRDSRKIVTALQKITEDGHIEERGRLEVHVSEMLDRYLYVSLKEIDMAELINELVKTVISYRLKISPGFFLLLKAFVTIEGVARKLDPNFNIMEHLEPIALLLLKEQLNPRRIAGDIFSSAADYATLFRDLPGELHEIIDQLRHGKVKIIFEHQGLDKMIYRHDRISNRIVFSIIIASLVIGSSLIILSKIPPLFMGIPVIGILGFMFAAFLGFGLVLSILWRGKL